MPETWRRTHVHQRCHAYRLPALVVAVGSLGFGLSSRNCECAPRQHALCNRASAKRNYVVSQQQLALERDDERDVQQTRMSRS